MTTKIATSQGLASAGGGMLLRHGANFTGAGPFVALAYPFNWAIYAGSTAAVTVELPTPPGALAQGYLYVVSNLGTGAATVVPEYLATAIDTAIPIGETRWYAWDNSLLTYVRVAVSDVSVGPSGVTGSGTLNFLAQWTAGTVLGDSILEEIDVAGERAIEFNATGGFSSIQPAANGVGRLGRDGRDWSSVWTRVVASDSASINFQPGYGFQLNFSDGAGTPKFVIDGFGLYASSDGAPNIGGPQNRMLSYYGAGGVQFGTRFSDPAGGTETLGVDDQTLVVSTVAWGGVVTVTLPAIVGSGAGMNLGKRYTVVKDVNGLFMVNVVATGADVVAPVITAGQALPLTNQIASCSFVAAGNGTNFWWVITGWSE